MHLHLGISNLLKRFTALHVITDVQDANVFCPGSLLISGCSVVLKSCVIADNCLNKMDDPF